jgi:hypothetical protein
MSNGLKRSSGNMLYQQKILDVPLADGVMEISSVPIARVKHLKAVDALRK